jgi:hypothetical protein
MEFDHRSGEGKVGAIADVKNSGAFRKLIAELEKCDLVCANCHRIRTYERRQSGWSKVREE